MALLSVRAFESVETLKSELADYVVSLTSGKACVVAVSGGSLPKMLSGLRHKDLSAWEVFLADERCVPVDSEDSNYKACVEALPDLKIVCVDTSLEPKAAAAAYASELEKRGGVIDVALLGVGPDGHTASLFPGHHLFLEKTNVLVDSIVDSPKPPPQRVTLTRYALSKAKHIIYVATGASKADVFAQTFRRSQTGHIVAADPKPNLPVAHVRASNGSATFFVDTAAIASIPALEES